MLLATPSRQRAPQLPLSWPAALSPAVLDAVPGSTPFLALDPGTIRTRYEDLLRALPGARVCYALKCNPAPEVVRTLAALGSGFEVASWGELEALLAQGVDAAEVLYSNPVKPASHIRDAARAGVWRFAFDGEGELRKLAQHAPGAAVYVRLRVDDSTSLFPLSRKFGTEAGAARDLLLLARELGLRPYGVTFHVGSQCTAPSAWRSAISAAGRLMRRLEADGVRLAMLDLGGGLPARYGDDVPDLEDFARTIRTAVEELLPYPPEHLVLEPGRYVVAEAAVMVTSVLGREERAGEDWIYLDVGAYNGLMETRQTLGEWPFPLWTSRRDHASAPRAPFTVTGPSCDSSDTMFVAAPLPATLDVDDRVYIGTAGAYTLSYASTFNGFPVPRVVVVEPPAGR